MIQTNHCHQSILMPFFVSSDWIFETFMPTNDIKATKGIDKSGTKLNVTAKFLNKLRKILPEKSPNLAKKVSTKTDDL